MDRQARREAQDFRFNAERETFPLLGHLALTAEPLQETDEGLKLFNEYRPEYYGYMSVITIRCVEHMLAHASERGVFGLCYFNGKPIETIESWRDFYQAFMITLSRDADELFFQTHSKPRLVEELEGLMDRLSYLVDGAYADPRSALSAGVHTASDSLRMFLESMSVHLRNYYDVLDSSERVEIIRNSGRCFIEMPFLNLYQVEALNFGATSTIHDAFVLEDNRLVFTKGSLKDFPVLPYYVSQVGINDEVEPSEATLDDIAFPFVHLGCPITLEPKVIPALWQMGVNTAEKAGLL
jgi:hypothetical protein